MKNRPLFFYMFLFLFPFLITGGCISPAKGTGQEKDAAPSQPAQGFHISNGKLIDATGNEFIIRGISYPYCWFPGRTDALTGIKNAGANTV
ncbi:MAG: hypothetical protein JXB88_07970 [Spirochaetales bacterium]|nr:hypothetical protein [Spirochaetales bacterium]